MNILMLNGNLNRIIELQTNKYTFIHFSMQHRVNVRVVYFIIISNSYRLCNSGVTIRYGRWGREKRGQSPYLVSQKSLTNVK